MTDWKDHQERMLRVRAQGDVVMRHRVAEALTQAGVPQAKLEQDEEGMPVCTRTGYLTMEGSGSHGSKVADVPVIGRDNVTEPIRQGERDAVMQQARAALVAAGFEVRVNKYGHLKVIDR